MKEELREKILALGADVCGFASINRFEQAPKGFHPCDIYKECKTVIVIGKALPKGLYLVEPRLIYGHFNYQMCPQVDEVSMKAASLIESVCPGKAAIPMPSDSPYEYWDATQKVGKGLLSMKHAAVNAGVGTLGKNTLLLNQTFGNRLVLGCILTNAEIESDPYAEKVCKDQCHLCIQSCPVEALDGTSVVQKLCRENTYHSTEKGYETVECNKCRTVCPMRLGK